MRKIISFVLVLAMCCTVLYSLVGCDAQQEGQIELTFWHLMSGDGEDALRRQVDAFNSTIGAERGIHVTPVYIDWPGTASFATALADGNDSLPDIFQLYGEMVSYVKDLDTVIWAEDYIDSDKFSISKDDFIPATLSAFTINERLLSLPYAISTLLLYYNETYLNQAGYSAPPKTLSEMREMLPDLVRKTDARYALHTKIGDYELENFITIQGQNGTYVTDSHNGRTGAVTSVTCESALISFLNEWGGICETGTVNFLTSSTTEEFASGVDAMALMTSARIASVSDMIGDKYSWGVAPIPLISADDVGGATVNGSSLVMFDHGDEQRTEAAWLLMEYLTSPEAQTMLMEDMGYLPVNVNTLDYRPYQEAVAKQPQLSVLFDVLNRAPSTAVMTFFPDNSSINTVMVNAIEKYSKGDSSAEEACSEIVNGCNAVLDEYYRTNPIE